MLLLFSSDNSVAAQVLPEWLNHFTFFVATHRHMASCSCANRLSSSEVCHTLLAPFSGCVAQGTTY